MILQFMIIYCIRYCHLWLLGYDYAICVIDLLFFLNFSYFKQELSRERDPLRRSLLLIQIRSVEENILGLLQAQRLQIQKENDYMQRALDEFEKKRRHVMWICNVYLKFNLEINNI